MIYIIKSEFLKLKRFHILFIGLIGMTLPAILSIFTQTVATPEAQVQNYDFTVFFSNTIWNDATIFMPVIFTLIGGYIINREFTDHTLKIILPIPISFRRLLLGKLLTMGILSILFGFYSFIVTLVVGSITGVSGFGIAMFFKCLMQILGISFCIYLSVLPIIAFTGQRPGLFIGGVIVSFLFGYSSMFIKDETIRSLYPILSGLTIIGFDTKTYMNTSAPGNLLLSLASLAAVVLLTVGITLLANPIETAAKSKNHKPNSRFLRRGQKGENYKH